MKKSFEELFRSVLKEKSELERAITRVDKQIAAAKQDFKNNLLVDTYKEHRIIIVNDKSRVDGFHKDMIHVVHEHDKAAASSRKLRKEIIIDWLYGFKQTDICDKRPECSLRHVERVIKEFKHYTYTLDLKWLKSIERLME